jgi:2-polyprenyl-3-methyl-5-hydroxy-6-metoxy-1,4-benzoquinol methylase
MRKKLHQVNFSVKQPIVFSNHQSILDLLIFVSLNDRVILIENVHVKDSFSTRMLFFIQDLKAPSPFNAQDFNLLISEHYIPVVLCSIYDTGSNKNELKFTESIVSSISGMTIMPIVIVGTEHCLAENDFILNRGAVILKQLPIVNSITELNHVFNEGYKEVSNSFSMSVHFNKILSSYIYKGPVLEWYYRIKVMLEKSYQGFEELLPTKGVIYDLGCGYGFLDYFLFMKSSERTIIGVDYDGDKITVANNSYLKNNKLTFIEGDIMQVQVQHADAVVILDVLHYLPADSQKKLIRSSFEGLNVGGILIIRDGDSSQVEKHKRTKLTEFFSTRLLMFNKKTEKQLCFISSETIIETLSDFNVDVKIVDKTKYTSNIIHYVVKK